MQAVLVSWTHPEKGGIPPDFRCSGNSVAEQFTEDATEAATKATTLKFVISMYKKGYTTAQIADVAGVDEKQIQDIIKNAKLLPV